MADDGLLGHFEASAEPETWYHLTDNPRFSIDPEHEPEDNSFSIEDRSGQRGIYLAKDPSSWFSAAGQGYARPYLAEVHAHPSVNEAPGVHGRWGGEMFVPAEHYDKLHLHRVIPIDAHVREHYGAHGWIEEHHGTEFDTGEPLRRNPDNRNYPFKPKWNDPSAYRYPGPDVRDMTPEQHDSHRDRWLDYLKRDRGFEDEDLDYYRQQHDSHRTASRPARGEEACSCCQGNGEHTDGSSCERCTGSGRTSKHDRTPHCPGQPQPKRRRWREREAAAEPETYYHGTHLDLDPGDMIEPGHRKNWDHSDPRHVYFSVRPYNAAGYGDVAAYRNGQGIGQGRVYQVEPTGPVEADENSRGHADYEENRRSAHPLRVVRQLSRDETFGHRNVTASADDGGMTGNPWDSIRMASPAEYGKYSYPDYPRAKTPATLARYFRKHEPDYYEQVRRSVEAHGVQEPVLLRYRDPRGTPLKRPVVMSGHHRAAAAWEAGKDMPVGDYDNQEHYEASTTDFGQKWWQDHHELKEAAGDPQRKEATVQAEAAADDSEWGYESYTPPAERTESVRHILDHYLPSDADSWDEVRDNLDFTVAGRARKVLDSVRRNGVRRPIPIDYEQTPPRVMNGHTRVISSDMAGVEHVPTRQHQGFMDPDDPDERGNQPYHREHWTNRPEWQEALRADGFKDPAAARDETSNDYKDIRAEGAAMDEHPVHRGIGIALSPEDEAVVGDESLPVAHRARYLLDAVTREGHEPLGQHWTTDRDRAEFFSGRYRGSPGPAWEVMFHATHPEPHEIITDPGWRAEHEVNESEDEVPVHPRTEMELTGVSWKPRGGQWTRHMLSEPEYHRAGTSDTAHMGSLGGGEVLAHFGPIPLNHEDMSDAQLRQHMRDRHGFTDSPDDPDWLIEETHRGEHADAPLEHRHPDLESDPEWDEDVGVNLGDKDFLQQHGIEASRQDPGDQELLGHFEAAGEYRLQHTAPGPHAGHRPLHDYLDVHPDTPVRIYRSAPPGTESINSGDWISLSHQYAHQHGRHASDPDRDWPVYTAEVPAQHVHWDENDENEHGYNGPDIHHPDVHDEETGGLRSWEDWHEDHPHGQEAWAGASAHLSPEDHDFVHDDTEWEADRADRLLAAAKAQGSLHGARWRDDLYPARDDAEEHAAAHRGEVPEGHRQTAFTVHRDDSGAIEGVAVHPYRHDDEDLRRYQHMDLEGQGYEHPALDAIGRPAQHEASRVEDYGMSHRPMEDTDQFHDLGARTFGQDVYEHPEYYGGTGSYGTEHIRQMRAARGKPDHPVTIYRAMHQDAPREINPGDWVAASKKYADFHAQTQGYPADDWHVVSATVPARHIRSGAGSDLHEWGYWGPKVTDVRVHPRAHVDPFPGHEGPPDFDPLAGTRFTSEAAAEPAEAPQEPDYGQWPEFLRSLRYRKRNEPEMHRGMAIDLPQDLHDFVMDSQQTPDRQARAIADHLRTNGLGMHWSVNPKISRDFSVMERRKQPGTTRVIVHAKLPELEHIETDPERLHEESVFRHDNWLVGEKEIPLKPGAPVHVTGVTWYGVNGNRKRRGNLYGQEHIAVALPAAEAAAEPREELPPDPGTAEIPEGHVRLWHYTPLRNVPSIGAEGLQRRYARGDSGTGDLSEPSAGVWASTKRPDELLNSHDSAKAVVEFHAHPDEISGNAESPWQAMTKDRTYDPEKLRDWAEGYHHVIMRGDVPRSSIVAIHEPWHAAARYMRDDPAGPASYQWVKDDYAAGGNDHLEPYVRGLRALEGGHQREAAAVTGARYDPGLPNPQTHGQEWFHGTQARPEDLHHGFAGPLPHSQYDEEMSGHLSFWNTHLGPHFAADHGIASHFANNGASIEDHEDGYEGPEPSSRYEMHTPMSVVHARLHLRNPKVYASEHDMDNEVYEHETGRGNWIAKHFGDGYEHEDPHSADYDPEDVSPDEEWPLAARFRHDDKMPLIGADESPHQHPVFGNSHPGQRMRAQWLSSHPDKGNIAARFRDRLIAQGHDGIVYGNELEGDHAEGSGAASRTCAIAFHPGRQVEIAQHHTAEHPCLSRNEAEMQRRRMPQAGQEELPGVEEHVDKFPGGFRHGSSLDVVAHFEQFGSGPFFQQKLFHQQPDPTLHGEDSRRHNPADPLARVHWRQQHEEGYVPPPETWDHPEYGMRDEESGLYRHPEHGGYHCHACTSYQGEPVFHDDSETAENHDTARTDWDEDYQHLPETMHRGIWMGGGAHHLDQGGGLTGHLAADQILHLARPFGTHWTPNEAQARHYSGIGTSGPDRSHENLNVIIHARKPAREDIEEDPEKLADGGVYGIGYHDDEEIPLREHAPVHVLGVSWRRGSDPQGEWQHHDFPQPVERTAALEADAEPQQPSFTWDHEVQTSTGYEPRSEVVSGPFYHGGRARLGPGGLITPNRKPNPWGDEFDERGRSIHTYFSTNPGTAVSYSRELGGRGHLYEVEPTGEVKWDGGGGDGSWKTRHPLRVIRKIPRGEWDSLAAPAPQGHEAALEVTAVDDLTRRLMREHRVRQGLTPDPTEEELAGYRADAEARRQRELADSTAREEERRQRRQQYLHDNGFADEDEHERFMGQLDHDHADIADHWRRGHYGEYAEGGDWHGDEPILREHLATDHMIPNPDARAASHEHGLAGLHWQHHVTNRENAHPYGLSSQWRPIPHSRTPDEQALMDALGGDGRAEGETLDSFRHTPVQPYQALPGDYDQMRQHLTEHHGYTDEMHMPRNLPGAQNVHRGLHLPGPIPLPAHQHDDPDDHHDPVFGSREAAADPPRRNHQLADIGQSLLNFDSDMTPEDRQYFQDAIDHARRGAPPSEPINAADARTMARSMRAEDSLADAVWDVRRDVMRYPRGVLLNLGEHHRATLSPNSGGGWHVRTHPANYGSTAGHIHHDLDTSDEDLPGALRTYYDSEQIRGALAAQRAEDEAYHAGRHEGALEAAAVTDDSGLAVVAHFGEDGDPGHFGFYSGHDRPEIEPRTTELEDHLRGDHAYGNWHMDRDLEDARNRAYSGPGTNAAHWRQFHMNMDAVHRQAHERELGNAQSAIEHGAPASHVEDTRRELESAHHPQMEAENEERRAHDEAVAEHRENGSVQMHGNRVEFGEMEAHLREAHGIPHDALPEYHLPTYTHGPDRYESDLEEAHNQAHGEMGSYRHNDEGDWINMHGQPTGAWDAEHHLVQHHGFDLDDLRREEPSFDEMERQHAENHERDRRFLTHHLADEMDEEGHLPHHEWGEHDEEQYQATGQIPGYRGQQAQLGEYRHHPDYGELEAPGDEPDVQDTAFSYRHQPYQAAPRSHEDLWGHLREQHGITQSGDTSRMPAQHFLHEVHDKLHHGDEGSAQVHQERWTPHQHDEPEGHHDPVFGSRQAAELVGHFAATDCRKVPRMTIDTRSADRVLQPATRFYDGFFEGVANWSPQSLAEAAELFTDLPGFFDAVYEGLLAVAGHLDDAPVDEAMPDALRHMAGVVLNVAEDARLLASRLEEAGPEGMWETPKA